LGFVGASSIAFFLRSNLLKKNDFYPSPAHDPGARVKKKKKDEGQHAAKHILNNVINSTGNFCRNTNTTKKNNRVGSAYQGAKALDLNNNPYYYGGI
jgi:hypothetical protein